MRLTDAAHFSLSRTMQGAAEQICHRRYAKTLLLVAALTIGQAAVATAADMSNVLSGPFEPRHGPIDATTLGQGHVVIRAGAQTNWFVSPWDLHTWDNAPTLLIAPKGDFSISAKITLDPISRWDSGALTLFADKDHWAKLCLEMAEPQGPLTVVSVVTNGVSDDSYAAPIVGKTLYLKAAKTGSGLSFHVSQDGQNWKMVRAFRLQSDAQIKAGFLAQSPVGTGIAVDFNDLRIVTDKN